MIETLLNKLFNKLNEVFVLKIVDTLNGFYYNINYENKKCDSIIPLCKL